MKSKISRHSKFRQSDIFGCLEESLEYLNQYLRMNAPSQVDLLNSIPVTKYKEILNCAFRLRVISLEQSISGVLQYLLGNKLSILTKILNLHNKKMNLDNIEHLDIMFLREGHISNVFKISIFVRDIANPLTFGLNIARDLTLANVELEKIRKNLLRWSKENGSQALPIYSKGCGPISWLGEDIRVPLFVMEWLENSRELHLIKNSLDRNGLIFIRIDSFTDSQPPQVIGSKTNQNISDQLWKSIIRKLTLFSSFDIISGTVSNFDVSINRGDVMEQVFDQGFEVFFVSCSTDTWKGPLGLWPYKMTFYPPDFTNTNSTVFFKNPKSVLEGISEGMNNKRRYSQQIKAKILRLMFESALSFSLGDILHHLPIRITNKSILTNIFHTTKKEIEYIVTKRLK